MIYIRLTKVGMAGYDRLTKSVHLYELFGILEIMPDHPLNMR